MVSRNPLTPGGIFFGLLLFVVVACSCNQRPARKKLPDLAGDAGSWEGVMTNPDRQPEKIPGLPPFYATDTTLRIGGRAIDLLTIALPDQAFDSLAERLVTAYSPMAETLLDQLKARGEKGVLIDLRTCSSQDHSGEQSAAYLVDRPMAAEGRLSVPVVFCWDPASIARATAFIDALREMPGFRYTRIDGGRDGRPVDAGCFSADPPTNFDQQ